MILNFKVNNGEGSIDNYPVITLQQAQAAFFIFLFWKYKKYEKDMKDQIQSEKKEQSESQHSVIHHEGDEFMDDQPDFSKIQKHEDLMDETYEEEDSRRMYNQNQDSRSSIKQKINSLKESPLISQVRIKKSTHEFPTAFKNENYESDGQKS